MFRLPGEANKLLTENLSLTFLSLVWGSMKQLDIWKQKHTEHILVQHDSTESVCVSGLRLVCFTLTSRWKVRWFGFGLTLVCRGGGGHVCDPASRNIDKVWGSNEKQYIYFLSKRPNRRSTHLNPGHSTSSQVCGRSLIKFHITASQRSYQSNPVLFFRMKLSDCNYIANQKNHQPCVNCYSLVQRPTWKKTHFKSGRCVYKQQEICFIITAQTLCGTAACWKGRRCTCLRGKCPGTNQSWPHYIQIKLQES